MGKRRAPESGRDRSCDRTAADALRTFEHERLQSRFREKRGGDETIHTGTDRDHITGHRRSRTDAARSGPDGPVRNLSLIVRAGPRSRADSDRSGPDAPRSDGRRAGLTTAWFVI